MKGRPGYLFECQSQEDCKISKGEIPKAVTHMPYTNVTLRLNTHTLRRAEREISFAIMISSSQHIAILYLNISYVIIKIYHGHAGYITGVNVPTRSQIMLQQDFESSKFQENTREMNY